MALDYWEKVFKIMDKRDKEEKPKEIEIDKAKIYCKDFSKGEDGFCKHYMGCRVMISSCANECGVGG
jgi:hypothetical protein